MEVPLKLFLITVFFTLTLALYFFVHSVQLDHTTISEYHINKMEDSIKFPLVTFVRLGFQYFI